MVTAGVGAGSNMLRMGDYNARVVLDHIRRSNGGVSRIDIARATGLSAQTISNQVQRLMDAGLVSEGQRSVPQGRGNPPTYLNFNPNYAYVVGVHVDPSTILTTLVNLDGEIIAKVMQPASEEVEEVLEAMVESVRHVSASVGESKILGLGLAMPGPVDLATGEVVSPGNMPKWHRVPIRRMLQKATGLPTVMQKDSTAALCAELWGRNRTVAGVTLMAYLGYGLGCAFSVDGKPMVGASGNAGSAGPIGDRVSYPSIVQEAVQAGLLDPVAASAPPAQLVDAMQALADQAGEGVVAAQQVLRAAAKDLARYLMRFVDFIDASDVVIGGPNWVRLGQYLQEEMQSRYEEDSALRGVHTVSFHASDYGQWVASVGAATVVLDLRFSPSPGVLCMDTEIGSGGM